MWMIVGVRDRGMSAAVEGRVWGRHAADAGQRPIVVLRRNIHRSGRNGLFMLRIKQWQAGNIATVPVFLCSNVDPGCHGSKFQISPGRAFQVRIFQIQRHVREKACFLGATGSPAIVAVLAKVSTAVMACAVIVIVVVAGCLMYW
jgi:hypothetical protein